MSTISPSSSAISPAATLRRTVALVWSAVGVVIGAVLGFLVGSAVGLVVGAIVVGAALGLLGVVMTTRFVDSAVEVVVARVPARELDADGAPRLFNLLHGLCASAGVTVPNVSVTDDDGINALVVADPSHGGPADMIVTRGFVDRLERIEMEGAIAVCLARLRSGLVETQTLAVALSIASPWFIPATARRRVVAASFAAQAVFDADVKGVGITRYPPGLAAAFHAMLSGSTRVGSADARVAVLWLANPSGESEAPSNDARPEPAGSRVDVSHDERPPLSERLALLREI